MSFNSCIDVGVNLDLKKYKYDEIIKLRDLLSESGIPYEMTSGFPVPWISVKRYQICYPSKTERIISVREWDGTIGAEYDKLEIKGLLTEEEAAKGEVCGFLTSEDVFGRISNHFNQNRKEGER